MTTLFDFIFEEKEYSCLARTVINNNSRMYKLTVMNGDMERLLNRHNLIAEKDNEMQIPSTCEPRQKQLIFEIAKALQQHLKVVKISLAD